MVRPTHKYKTSFTVMKAWVLASFSCVTRCIRPAAFTKTNTDISHIPSSTTKQTAVTALDLLLMTATNSATSSLLHCWMSELLLSTQLQTSSTSTVGTDSELYEIMFFLPGYPHTIVLSIKTIPNTMGETNLSNTTSMLLVHQSLIHRRRKMSANMKKQTSDTSKLQRAGLGSIP